MNDIPSMDYLPWMKQQRNNYAANVVGRVEEVAKKKSPQDKYTNDQTVNLLSTKQLQKIVDIFQFSTTKKNQMVNPLFKLLRKVMNHLFKLMRKVKYAQNFGLDTSATNHVSCDLTLFPSQHKIKSIRIRLPNNTYVIGRCARIFFLSREFMIHNVLYILEFTLNILYVHSLASSLNYKLTFSRDTCDIQEMSTFRMIGQAKIHNGLYEIQCATKENFVLSMQTKNLFKLMYGIANLSIYQEEEYVSLHCYTLHQDPSENT